MTTSRPRARGWASSTGSAITASRRSPTSTPSSSRTTRTALPGNIESNPNSVDAKGKPVLVADAGGNDILGVRKRGGISVFSLLPFGSALPPGAPPGTDPIPVDPVPTSVVRGPDGSVYVGQLTGFPFVPGAASVFRIPPGGGAPEVVAVGPDAHHGHRAWARTAASTSRSSRRSRCSPAPAPGALIRIKPDGTRGRARAGPPHGPDGHRPRPPCRVRVEPRRGARRGRGAPHPARSLSRAADAGPRAGVSRRRAARSACRRARWASGRPT